MLDFAKWMHILSKLVAGSKVSNYIIPRRTLINVNRAKINSIITTKITTSFSKTFPLIFLITFIAIWVQLYVFLCLNSKLLSLLGIHIQCALNLDLNFKKPSTIKGINKIKAAFSIFPRIAKQPIKEPRI